MGVIALRDATAFLPGDVVLSVCARYNEAPMVITRTLWEALAEVARRQGAGGSS